jgi:peptidoglycan/xylan/chitin deacetylase (PgdA/CDA1 family)
MVYRVKKLHKRLIRVLLIAFLLTILICYPNGSARESLMDGDAKSLLISQLQMEAYRNELEEQRDRALEEAKLKDAEEALADKEPAVSEEVLELRKTTEDSAAAVKESTAVVKRAYLTFDDGPSPNTDKILDILDEYNVKGNFFVIGRFAEGYREQYNRILREGHILGMHSFSHIYTEVYESADSFTADLNHVQYVIYSITGYTPMIYRFPGGSSNDISTIDMREFIDILDKRGIVYYDWNVNSGDAETARLPKEQIINNVFDGINGLENAEERSEVMILFHDLKEKTTTVEALPAIIEGLQAQGYVIAPIDENTKLIQHPGK